MRNLHSKGCHSHSTQKPFGAQSVQKGFHSDCREPVAGSRTTAFISKADVPSQPRGLTNSGRFIASVTGVPVGAP
jgi:hypothetical protein